VCVCVFQKLSYFKGTTIYGFLRRAITCILFWMIYLIDGGSDGKYIRIWQKHENRYTDSLTCVDSYKPRYPSPLQWWAPQWSNGSVLDYRWLPPVFESRREHIRSLFHLRLRFITFWGRSAHLAYHVHKSGRKTPIITTITMVTGRHLEFHHDHPSKQRSFQGQ